MTATRPDGFTLMELLAGAVMAALVLTAGVKLYIAIAAGFTRAVTFSELNQSAQNAISFIGRTVENAETAPAAVLGTSAGPSTLTVTTWNQSTYVFTYQPSSGTVTYTVSGSAQTGPMLLARDVVGVPWPVVRPSDDGDATLVTLDFQMQAPGPGGQPIQYETSTQVIANPSP
jgi:hypothetical protein